MKKVNVFVRLWDETHQDAKNSLSKIKEDFGVFVPISKLIENCIKLKIESKSSNLDILVGKKSTVVALKENCFEAVRIAAFEAKTTNNKYIGSAFNEYYLESIFFLRKKLTEEAESKKLKLKNHKNTGIEMQVIPVAVDREFYKNKSIDLVNINHKNRSKISIGNLISDCISLALQDDVYSFSAKVEDSTLINVLVPKSIKDEIKMICKDSEHTVTSFCNQAFEDYAEQIIEKYCGF